ncbi:MAG: hypothetical protein Q8859_08600 [Bacteroidota bacterium]|nr:hypothetical protein [Bacteroidota bacterium]
MVRLANRSVRRFAQRCTNKGASTKQQGSNKGATPYFVRPLDVVQSWFLYRNDNQILFKLRLSDAENIVLVWCCSFLYFIQSYSSNSGIKNTN